MKLHDAIRATFNSPEMLAIRKAIRKQDNAMADWDWHHGGCFGVANAICSALGKKAVKMAICQFEPGKEWELPWAADHAIVKVGNEFYDGRGLRTAAQIKKEYFASRKKVKVEIKSATAKGVWYADDWYLEAHQGLIKKLLLRHLDK